MDGCCATLRDGGLIDKLLTLLPQSPSQIPSSANNQQLSAELECDWGQYHTPQDLAVSISIEAAELLEVFQWGIKEDMKPDKIEKIKEELADVMIYCISLANTIDVDITEIVNDKIKLNAEKYPVGNAKGEKKKYNEL